MTEIWKDIEGYEGKYQISNIGRVKSLERINEQGRHQDERIMKSSANERGYLFVVLLKNGRTKTNFVHRLVGQAFIENPNNFPCINHKDENRQNNSIDNLEWCSYHYNNNYGKRGEKIAKRLGKKVVGTCLDGTVEQYPSLSEAARRLMGKSHGAADISAAIKHNWMAFGRRWSYAENLED